MDGGTERAEITYDSTNSENTKFGRRTTGQLVFGTVVILLSGAVVLLGVALGVVALLS